MGTEEEMWLRSRKGSCVMSCNYLESYRGLLKDFSRSETADLRFHRYTLLPGRQYNEGLRQRL